MVFGAKNDDDDDDGDGDGDDVTVIFIMIVMQCITSGHSDLWPQLKP